MKTLQESSAHCAKYLSPLPARMIRATRIIRAIHCSEIICAARMIRAMRIIRAARIILVTRINRVPKDSRSGTQEDLCNRNLFEHRETSQH